MTEGLKERPAMLRRTPRPAPDDSIDPVDYSPAAVAPAATIPAAALAQAAVPEDGPVGGGVEKPEAADEPGAQAPVPVKAPAAAAATKQKPAPRTTKATKPTSRKANRREVTFPLSTRISEEVSDILYSTAEEEDMSVREVIEQAIKARWGKD
ncbi:hypothetical protein AB6813_14105 [bacterium RCC_150]